MVAILQLPFSLISLNETNGIVVPTVLFHNYFPPISEQPKQRILACKQNNQLPGVQQSFINIAAV